MSFYFIYKITQLPGNMVKKLDKIEQYENFREAKKQIRSLRENQPDTETSLYKIIFAESELDAEEKLQEKREAQIVKEWEK